MRSGQSGGGFAPAPPAGATRPCTPRKPRCARLAAAYSRKRDTRRWRGRRCAPPAGLAKPGLEATKSLRCAFQRTRAAHRSAPRPHALMLLAWVAALVLGVASAHAQSATQRIEVYLEQPPNSPTARLYFMDAFSGLSTVASVESGHNFTLLGDYVLYQKGQSGAVMRVRADGTLEPHPFIQRTADTVALYWVTTPDRAAVAWVRVNAMGQSEAYVAWADGSDLRQLPLSPEDTRALYPLALSEGRRLFFYDSAYPIVPPQHMPFPLLAHVAEYDIEGEMLFPLPAEPNCACPAAVTADGRIFARLEAPQGQGPFAFHVWDLLTNADIQVPPPSLPQRQAGDLLLNATGTLAVYNAASGLGVETGLIPEQYALVLVDAAAGEQRVLLPAGPDRYIPQAFIDEDAALLLTGSTRGGTYKLDLESGALQQVSERIFLGVIVR